MLLPAIVQCALVALIGATAVSAIPGSPKNADAKTWKKGSADGKQKFTMYWIAYPSEYPAPTGDTVRLGDCDGKPLTGPVSRKFAEAARMEGTAYVDGKLLNTGSCGGSENDHFDMFAIPDVKKAPYGLGCKDNALEPYISIAANRLPYHGIFQIKELIGVPLPGGESHNGCVRVDDTCGSCGDEAEHVDFLVASNNAHNFLKTKDLSSCTIKEMDIASCPLLKYTVDTSPLTAPAGSLYGKNAKASKPPPKAKAGVDADADAKDKTEPKAKATTPAAQATPVAPAFSAGPNSEEEVGGYAPEAPLPSASPSAGASAPATTYDPDDESFTDDEPDVEGGEYTSTTDKTEDVAEEKGDSYDDDEGDEGGEGEEEDDEDDEEEDDDDDDDDEEEDSYKDDDDDDEDDENEDEDDKDDEDDEEDDSYKDDGDDEDEDSYKDEKKDEKKDKKKDKKKGKKDDEGDKEEEAYSEKPAKKSYGGGDDSGLNEISYTKIKPATTPITGSFMGPITFYNPAGGSVHCHSKTAEDSDMIAAISGENFSEKKHCGQCAKVSGPLGSVKVMIVDSCPSCEEGHIDLTEAAFLKINKKSVGKYNHEWHFIPC